MKKVDFKKELKHLYKPSRKEFTVVEVPPMLFLMVDGHGDPNVAQEYTEALEALYAVAYKLKFASKKRWNGITPCRRWKVSGGRMTWTLSPLPATRASGIGR
jgi:hypothetical protein